MTATILDVTGDLASRTPTRSEVETVPWTGWTPDGIEPAERRWVRITDGRRTDNWEYTRGQWDRVNSVYGPEGSGS